MFIWRRHKPTDFSAEIEAHIALENPKEFTSTCGFNPAKEGQLAPMIAFRDVNSEIK
jgi:hypothetical protein